MILAASVAAIIYAYATVFLTPWLLVAWVLWRVLKALRTRRKGATA